MPRQIPKYEMCKKCRYNNSSTDSYPCCECKLIEAPSKFEPYTGKPCISIREDIHFTVEQVLANPQQCIDKYEDEITKVRCENNGYAVSMGFKEIEVGLYEGKISNASKIINDSNKTPEQKIQALIKLIDKE